MEDKIKKILESVYTGTNHIGEVYNNEAISKLLDLLKQQLQTARKEEREKILTKTRRLCKEIMRGLPRENIIRENIDIIFNELEAL